MAGYGVQLAKHHLEELTARPLTGIRELVWNSLDADARRVEVSFARNALDGIDEIRVEDDGHGMSRADAEEAFGSLGASWKLDVTRSKGEGRVLHGKHGRGRFRAAGLGRLIVWETVAEDGGERPLTRIEIRGENLRRVEIGDPQATTATSEPGCSSPTSSSHPRGSARAPSSGF